MRTLAIRCSAAICLAGLAAAGAKADELGLARGSRLMLAARINGAPVTALLDSAAEATILDRAFAKRLGLGRGAAVVGQGSGAESFEASLVGGVTIEALGLKLPKLEVAVADLGDVGRRLLGKPVDVILGRELFDAARLRIDIGRRRIEVVPRASAPRGERLSLATLNGVETFPVRVEGGEPVAATFDLGNGSEVLIGRGYAERARLLTDGRPVRTQAGGGLGGETRRAVLTLTSVEVGGRRFTDVPAAIDAQPTASDVNVGVSLLRHFVITTDFAAHALWLEARD